MKIVIIGAGEVGFHLAKALSEENYDTTVIDISPEKCARVGENLDVMVIQGDGASPEVVRQAEVGKADMLIAVTRIDEVNLIASQLAHELGAKKIIARLRNTEYSTKDTIIHPEKFGIDKVIHPEKAVCKEILSLVQQLSATSVVDFEDGRLQLIGIRLDNGCPIHGKTLKELREENGDFSFSAVSVLRGRKTIIPHGDFEFDLDDICYFLVKKTSVKNVLTMVGKPIQETENVMILGGGKIGRSVAEALQDDLDVRLVEIDRSKAQHLATTFEKTLVLNSDGTDIEFLRSENMEELDSFIAVTQNEQTNLLSSLLAKHLGATQTIVHVSTTDYIPAMKVIGLDSVVSKNMSTVNAILEYIKSDQKVSITSFEDIDVEALEFNPTPGSPVTKVPLAEVGFPVQSIVGAVNHHGHISIAAGDTQLTEDDTVLMFARPKFISQVEKLFS
ncbi:MAG: Trk system potassium transporter TrkA [Candidatus Marinimicrobia bacterium]|jgi:trk system potassium uptake protein TrkA|nr:Trk system potassium transporter TrkA [Candidatus Neomarinimicrobiota bacterium]MDP7653787.1 Trk system potassium transporter TrkA [Candidatus Neomarinimicrobiota bacterium]|tara:strand:+ start:3351 stop:4691 length:1341 start_codon:yes stop_codon:yes gene_type:complete